MVDKDLFAHAIGIVRTANSIDEFRLAFELNITVEKAEKILEDLSDTGFIEKFNGFYARIDLASFN